MFASRSAVVSAAVVLPYLRPTIQSAACHPECTVMIDHPLYKIVEAGLFEQLELIAVKLQQAMALLCQPPTLQSQRFRSMAWNDARVPLFSIRGKRP